MGQTNSGWIDASIVRFKDQSKLWAVRRHELDREIAMREKDLKLMLQTMPDDTEGHAQSKAYLAALRQTAEELHVEILRQR